MFCHKCGSQIEDGHVFCHKCGTKVVYEGGQAQEKSPSEAVEIPVDSGGILRRCPVCKAVNNGYAKFCVECGADMDVKPPVAEEAPASEPESEYKAAEISVSADKTDKAAQYAYTEWANSKANAANSAPRPAPKPASTYAEPRTYAPQAPQTAAHTNQSPADSAPYRSPGPAPAYSFSEQKTYGNAPPRQDNSAYSPPPAEKGRATDKSFLIFLLKWGSMVVVAIVIGLVILAVANPILKNVFTEDRMEGVFGIINDIIEPGAEVRGAHLSGYSSSLTVEQASDNYFTNEKWSTYRSEGYKFVAFTGSCDYGGKPADVRITFKITGDYFIADSLEINGVDMGNLMLLAMLNDIYGEYD